MNIKKAIEISEAKIGFVSLVDKAANQRSFLIAKSTDGQAQFSTLGKILKVDDATHYVTGIVYEPLVEDAHGNFMTEDEIRKAAYWFAKNGDQVDLQHSFEPVDGVTVVETYVAPSDIEVGGQAVVKGTWLMTVAVENTEVWEKVQKGEVTGFSMGGVGAYSETETDLSSTVEKRGLLTKLAGLLGLDVVEKGQVADSFHQSAPSSNFWDAVYALQDTLFRYNWRTDQNEIETDEVVIREAFADFSTILTDILATPNVVKAIGVKPISKAGKKISDKNHKTLQSAYDQLGDLLATFAEDDNNEEENEVTKTEVQTLIDEAIQKALGSDPVEPPTAPELKSETVLKMVEDAVQKALSPADEPLTADAVSAMVTEAVAKAVEPVLKSRGFASNLDGEKIVEKNKDRHYLAGVL